MGLKEKLKEATRSEDVALYERPLIVRMLWKDRFVFSNSVLRDWWVVQKNRHIFFSLFLSHPLHPFSRRERICMVLALLMFGYFLSGGAYVILNIFEEVTMANLARNCTGCAVDFCTATSADSDFISSYEADACNDARPLCSSEADPGDSDYCEKPNGRQVSNSNWEDYQKFKADDFIKGVAMFFGVLVLQAAYDNLAKWTFVCYCAEWGWVTRRKKMKEICDKMGWGMGGFLLVLSFSLCIAMLVIIHPDSPQNADKVVVQCNATVAINASAVPEEMCDFSIMDTVQTFSTARFISFCATVTAVLTVKFFFKRSWLGFRIPKKKKEGDEYPKDKKTGDRYWKKFGEWQKLKDEYEKPYNPILGTKRGPLGEMGEAEYEEKAPDRYKKVTVGGPGLGFPNYDQTKKTKYPGDPSFGDGTATGAEKSLFSNVCFSNEPLKKAEGGKLVNRPKKTSKVAPAP